ncbi:MAG TPA: hypothetical protein VFA46_17875 [Actinomycetes bacterium]|jgi:outer membrane murein-binding lipoprotein Lpp|nr:hypothetical protein [Actinomycetes bacterium]
MKHANLRLAVVGALVVLALAGCGGGSKTSQTQTKAPTTNPPATNGLENKSAAQVEQDAAAALRAAKSVHVTGTGRSQGKPEQVDLRIQGNSSTGTIEMADAAFEITTVGPDTYLKADQRAWQAMGAPASLQRLAGGRWVKLGAQQAGNVEGLSLDSLAAQLTKNDSPLQPGVEQATLDGNRVVALSQQNGSKLYVANTGLAYPLRVEIKGRDAGRLDFTEYGSDFHITAPSNAVDLKMHG